jgi:hypothetical protein
MIDAVPSDVTPISGPSYFQEYRDKGRTPLSDRSKSHVFDATKMMTDGPVLISHAGVLTRTVAELRQNIETQDVIK